jgi:hypothetical protein
MNKVSFSLYKVIQSTKEQCKRNFHMSIISKHIDKMECYTCENDNQLTRRKIRQRVAISRRNYDFQTLIFMENIE